MKKKLWGAVFGADTNPDVERFTSSIFFDRRLAPYDIEGSIAHAMMLSKCGIISAKEKDALVKGLREIGEEIKTGKIRFSEKDEDIHLGIEKRLRKKAGRTADKLHTARSRNDQVALDLRLYLRDETTETVRQIRSLQKTIVALAEKNIDAVMPGFTHLQHAQPVLFSHHLMSYYFMMERDAERMEDCLKRIDRMPLGAGALAGSSLPVDRRHVAKLLGFSSLALHSIDAVSDRDFAIEFLAAASIIMMHLSRLSEEIIIWMSQEFDFIRVDESMLTGSSMMPQKKNPDVVELVRGKTGRVYGALVNMLTVMKGLPLAYNRDLQEDKFPLFDAVDTVKQCLKIMPVFIGCISVNAPRLNEAAGAGFIFATDLAEHLVRRGVPFREAHRKVGKLVKFCASGNVKIENLTAAKLASFGFGPEVKKLMTPENSVRGKRTRGGTSPGEVMNIIREAREKLNA